MLCVRYMVSSFLRLTQYPPGLGDERYSSHSQPSFSQYSVKWPGPSSASCGGADEVFFVGSGTCAVGSTRVGLGWDVAVGLWLVFGTGGAWVVRSATGSAV